MCSSSVDLIFFIFLTQKFFFQTWYLLQHLPLPFGSVTHFSTVIYIQRYLKSERHPLFLAIIQQFATFHLYLSMWVVFSFLNVALTVSNWFMYCSCNSNFFSFKMDMLNNRHNTPRMTRLARDIVQVYHYDLHSLCTYFTFSMVFTKFNVL